MQAKKIRRLFGVAASTALIASLSYIFLAQQVSPSLALLSIASVYASLIVLMELLAMESEAKSSAQAEPATQQSEEPVPEVNHFHIDRHEPR